MELYNRIWFLFHLSVCVAGAFFYSNEFPFIILILPLLFMKCSDAKFGNGKKYYVVRQLLITLSSLVALYLFILNLWH
jgi:hypothetical protein